MRIYLHKRTVTVITTEESPDAIERLIDSVGTGTIRVDARTDPANRMAGPSLAIADPPECPPRGSDKARIHAWANAYDAWKDSWPRREAFPGESN